MFLTSLFKPVAYISLPVFIVRWITQQSPLARFWVRVAMYYTALSLTCAWGVFISIPMSLAGEKLNVNYVVARSFAAFAGRLMDISFEVEGEEHLDTRPAILVGNHQSGLDVLFLGRIFPHRAVIMAKKELRFTPLGPYLAMSGAIMVDRGNSAKAVESLRAAGALLHEQQTSLWMFPEGTRTTSERPALRPFKKGAFHLAITSGVPIIPVVCENAWKVYRDGAMEPGVLKIRVLPPIDTKGLKVEDVPALAVRVRELMLKTLIDISPAPPGDALLPPPLVESKPEAVTEQRVPIPGSLPTDTLDRVRDASRESIGSVSSSSRSGSRHRGDGSETGADTEEDEGMVLVGRPASG